MGYGGSNCGDIIGCPNQTNCADGSSADPCISDLDGNFVKSCSQCSSMYYNRSNICIEVQNQPDCVEDSSNENLILDDPEIVYYGCTLCQEGKIPNSNGKCTTITSKGDDHCITYSEPESTVPYDEEVVYSCEECGDGYGISAGYCEIGCGDIRNHPNKSCLFNNDGIIDRNYFGDEISTNPRCGSLIGSVNCDDTSTPVRVSDTSQPVSINLRNTGCCKIMDTPSCDSSSCVARDLTELDFSIEGGRISFQTPENFHMDTYSGDRNNAPGYLVPGTKACVIGNRSKYFGGNYQSDTNIRSGESTRRIFTDRCNRFSGRPTSGILGPSIGNNSLDFFEKCCKSGN